jgi:bifunctional oligoribonuclease and PAP phosphatase NrnA
LLQTLEVEQDGRVALLTLTDAMLAAAGSAPDETDGLINLPLTVKAIQAVVCFKEAGDGQWRVSLRSKGDIDVGRVARGFGGGGHRNASGCTLQGSLESVRGRIVERLAPEVAAHTPAPAEAPGA